MPHTTSLPLSQRLAKLGVNAPSEWYWKQDESEPYIVAANSRYMHSKGTILCHAYTTDELLELLPALTLVEKLNGCGKSKIEKGWYSVGSQHARSFGLQRPFHNKSLPECCGLMTAYLKENNLL